MKCVVPAGIYMRHEVGILWQSWIGIAWALVKCWWKIFLESDAFWYPAKRGNVSEKHFHEVLLWQLWFHGTHRKGEGEGKPLLETGNPLKPRNKILMRETLELPKSPAAHPSLSLSSPCWAARHEDEGHEGVSGEAEGSPAAFLRRFFLRLMGRGSRVLLDAG